MVSNKYHLVIMAGGVGSRFWPLSTQELPKQFIDALGVGRTFIQQTFDRFQGVVPAENVWVVTNERYAEIVHEQLPNVPVENILLEPCRRNTAPCIAYAAWRIKKRDPKASMVVAPSDHYIRDVEEFKRVIELSLQFASESDAIVTLGMKPTRPETGYGYIAADLTSPSLREPSIYRVDSFKEKPDYATACEYIKRKDYFWNSGIFIWNVSTIVNALRMFAPDISELFENMLPIYGTDKEAATIKEEFPKCRNISIDYAVLENADEIFVQPAEFGWSDVGTWGSLWTLAKRDSKGNVQVGEHIRLYETSNSIVHVPEGKQVVVQGLDGYIVAERDGRLLICKLEEEQRIKEFSEA